LLAPPAETDEAFEAFQIASNGDNSQHLKALLVELAPAIWTVTITNIDYPETGFCRHRHISVDKLQWHTRNATIAGPNWAHLKGVTCTPNFGGRVD